MRMTTTIGVRHLTSVFGWPAVLAVMRSTAIARLVTCMRLLPFRMPFATMAGLPKT